MSVPRKPGEVRWRYDHLCTPKQYSCSQLSIDFCALSISRLKPYSIDPLNGIPSYCDTICCDGGTEETCYDYDEDGKLNQYCAAVRFSFHTTSHISWTTWQSDLKCLVLILSTPTEDARVPKARRSVLRVSETFRPTQTETIWWSKYWLFVHILYQTLWTVSPAIALLFAVTAPKNKFA